MTEHENHPPQRSDDPMWVSRLAQEEELRFSAPAPQIEGYQILEKLGEAGQGQVWRAVQQTMGRQVALKVPRVGLLSSKRTLARFEREVEILAQLKHPHIAGIVDSGVHRGLYYYAMDLVEGQHLDQYVKDKALSYRQILELMKVICEAVQHAHQNGVIHRDLKPSNIIVTTDGHPYIVDFGLAKVLQADHSTITVSMDGEAAGTPAFMSPEQAAGQTEQIDTRTDVYSLGAILFTLLTNGHPHDLSGSHLDVLRRITEGEAIRPRKLCPKMDRDLEALLLKALEHDPDRRYSSAAGLVEDIDDYLNGLPLTATPRSRVRRAGSFVRRHRLGITIALSISVLITVAVVTLATSTVLIHREKQQTQEALEREEQARAEAQRQARIAQAVADFMNEDFLASVGLPRDRNRQMTVREVLDVASRKIEGRFRSEPLIEAAVRQTLGDTYTQLGDYAEAARQLERVRQIHHEHSKEEDPSAIRAMGSLGTVYASQGRYAEAEPLLRRSLALAKRVLGEKSLETVTYMNNLANLCSCQGRYEEAESLHLQQLAILKHAWGTEHRYTLDTIQTLAMFYDRCGQYEKAEPLCRQVLEIEARVFGADNPYTLHAKASLGMLLAHHGQYEEAEPLLSETWQAMKRVLGEQHPDTLKCMYNLAFVYGRQKRFPEAEAMYQQTLETQERVLGEEHEATLLSARDLATVYKQQMRYEQAEALYRRTTETSARVLGKEHPDTVETIRLLIALYEAWDKPRQVQQWRARLPADTAERTALSTASAETLEVLDDSRARDAGSGSTGTGETANKETERVIQELLAIEPRGGRAALEEHTLRSREAGMLRPANGSDIGPKPWAELRWAPVQGAVAYRVYFGTDPQNLVFLGEVHNVNGINSPDLQRTRWYHWRVDAVQSDNSVTHGTLWSFSTGDMVGWWRFDETDGQVAADSSGHGNDGELVGNPRWQQGHISGSLEFDGENDYVRVEPVSSLDITEEVTLAVWIKVDAFDRNHQTIISKGDTIWRLQRDKSRDAIQFGSVLALRGQRAIADGKWHHVVGTYDGTMARLFVDGTPDVALQAVGKIGTNDYNVLIGDNAEMPGRFWNGLIDDVRVYSYALTPDEVQALYTGGGPGPLPRPEWIAEEAEK